MVRFDSIAGLFFAQARRLRSKVLLRSKLEGRWRDVTWDEAASAVANVAAQLVRLGLAPGDRVALLSENRPEWLLADLACLACGLVDIPIYATSPAADVEELLRRCGAKALFLSDAEQWRKVAAVRERLPALRHVIAFDPAASDVTIAFAALASDGDAAPDAMLATLAAADEVKRRLAALRRSDVATILYTSGTTGAPKGVMLTHGNLLANCRSTLDHVALGPDDLTLSFLPLSHSFERTAGHYALLMAGGAIAYASSPERVPVEIREVKPTLVLGVPRFYEKVHDRILGAIERGPKYRRALFDFALRVADEVAACEGPPPLKLRFRHELAQRLVFSLLRHRMGGRLRFFVSGGAPLDPELVRFFGRLGLPLLEGYGLTEAAPVLTINQPGRIVAGSVGRAIPGVELKIAEDGEIVARGENVFAGYCDDPEATAAVRSPDGWLRTGDIGRLDADGFLWVTDRKKELIIGSGGKNVSPVRVESQLKRHRIVGDVCLVGDRRPYLVALIVPDEAALKTALAERGIAWSSREAMVRDAAVRALFDEAVAQGNAELAPPERVRRFLLLDEPFSAENHLLTPTLKVRRREVEKRWRPQIEALYAAP
jgi:long-chain acyl-CoA synthetase